MPDIDIRRAHGLGLAAARAAADRMAEHLGRRFDLKGEWRGQVLTFQRPGVTGSLEIGERDLHLSVSLGFLLKAMRGSIERAVLEELDKLFSEPSAGATRRPGASPRKGR